MSKAPARTYFENIVLKYDGDDCLIWPFSKDESGYGVLKYNGKKSNVSNHVCRAVYGEPPTPKHEAAHICGNGRRGCVNPKHLRWKTHFDNMQDNRTKAARQPRVPASVELKPRSTKNNGRRLDLTGQRFGRLTVVSVAGKDPRNNSTYWHCRCDCTNTKLVASTALRSGNTKSCGCWKDEQTSARNTTHGHACRGKQHPLYNLWCGMMQRGRSDHYYGVGVDECWHDFQNFIEDVGERPSKQHSLDRYPNKTGNYGPNNFRWATPTQQVRNRRVTALIGDRPLQEVAKELHLNPGTLKSRLRRGVTTDKLLLPTKQTTCPKQAA